MDATDATDLMADEHDGDRPADQVVAPEHPLAPHIGIAVEHRSRLASVVAVSAAVMTVAWFARALQTGEALAWVWFLVLAAVAVVQLVVVRDSRAPLLLADDHGVRVRHGETWSGLRWQDIDHVEVSSRSSWWHDGRIVVHPREVGADEDAAPETLSVALAATTRLRFDGLTGDLVADLDALASGRTPVVVVTRVLSVPDVEPTGHDDEPEQEETPDPRPAPVVQSGVEVVVLAATEGADGIVLPHQVTAEDRDQAEAADDTDTDRDSDSDDGDVDEVDGIGPVEPVGDRVPMPEPTPVVHYAPVDPGREPRRAARSETVRESVRVTTAALAAQRGAGEAPVLVGRVDDLESDEHSPRPADEPVIGPLVAAARHRARLSIDTLSERTRIRPHVLECIEVDDFEPCGGDFYARGHLRTLARVFGLDVQELLALYDARYASPEIEARQVFEAELATGIGGGVRAVATGPRWSVLAAAVVALGLVWGVAHVFTEQPQEIVSPAPDVDSAGLTHAQPTTSQAPRTALASLAVTAVGDSPQVVVRDHDGRILWAGKLASGHRQQVVGLAPFDVTASNGAAVKVSYLGKPRGTVGPSSAGDSRQFG
jgi:hypothetical protein